MAHPDGSLTRPLVQTLISILLICCSLTIASATPSVNHAAVLDFDGDGKTDYAITRGEWIFNEIYLRWYILGSGGGMQAQLFGLSGDRQIPGDYDGDGKWDIAVWRSDLIAQGGLGYFYIWRSSTNSFQVVQWGRAGDDMMKTQDFDGDSKADPTVVRAQNDGLLYWYSLMSQSGLLRVVQFGLGVDYGVRGDYDGDGKADIAVRRRGFNGETPANTFFILHSSDGEVEAHQFGTYQTDGATPGDYDGDGKTDIAVTRVDPNDPDRKITWYWRRSSDGKIDAQQFGTGNQNDGVAPGDYDGDGKTDVAVWRNLLPSYFIVNRSRDGIFVQPWGQYPYDGSLASILLSH